MFNMYDLSVDLEDEDEDFKGWFNQQIAQVMSQPNLKEKMLLLSLEPNKVPLSSDINKRKVREIILSKKAFDPSLNSESDMHSNEKITNFLRETIFDIYNAEFDYNILIEMSERIKRRDYKDGDESVNDIWTGLLKSIGDYSKCLTHFSKKLPGFSEFEDQDLFYIVEAGVLPLYALRHNVLYNSKVNENYNILSNGILYSKKRINLLFGKYLADLIVLFFKKCSSLNMTEFEKALFHPFVLLCCDINLIKSKDYLIDLKSYYINALINEFKLNNRDEKFSKNLMDLFKIIVVLELNKENYKCPSSQNI